MTMRVAFLLGAGASLPAEMPSTTRITELVLSGDGIARSSDGNYFFGQPQYAHAGIPDEHVPRIARFAEILRAATAANYGRQVNYEDISYVASQISDHAAGEFENPAVAAFVREIRRDVEPLLATQPGEMRHWDSPRLASETVNYIADVVWRSLSKAPRGWTT